VIKKEEIFSANREEKRSGGQGEITAKGKGIEECRPENMAFKLIQDLQ